MVSSSGAPLPHLLFVTSPMQGHINPVRRLAARVAAAGAGVTVSTAVSGHRRMFPSLASPDEEAVDAAGLLHAPFSDGYDEGFDPKVHDIRSYDADRARAVGCETLSGVVARLGERGRPVTCVVYTFMVGWVPEVARAHGIPAVLFWIQPAAVFAVYYHCFHGHAAVLASCANDPAREAAVRLPGLPPLKSRALPSIVKITSPEQEGYPVVGTLRDIFLALDVDGDMPTKVLVNTFDALEPEALRAVPQVELVAVGPVVPDTSPSSTDLSMRDDDANANGYIDWLDTQAARSVVYVSFGTIFTASKRQELEALQGLNATGRPYLTVLREVGADEVAALDGTIGGGGGAADGRQGMVVEWCDQARVLSHPAVGCFVTHCGWNSALESIASGVLIVAVPQWTDQPTVAWLVEERAGVGVRVEVDGEGVAERGEIQRCVETVMGDGGTALEIRARAARWMERAKEAVTGGGALESNLRAFLAGL